MTARNFPKDRRRLQRLRLNIMVHYRVDQPLHIKVMVGDKEIEAKMLDVNVGGMGLLTDFDIPIHSLLRISFSFFRMNKSGEISLYGPLEVTGQVRNNILQENHQHRLGIRFDKMAKQDQGHLGKFVQMTLNP
ncbi:MAG: PilZ domain-containing protein [Candidatus Omnitrophota bacterium]